MMCVQDNALLLQPVLEKDLAEFSEKKKERKLIRKHYDLYVYISTHVYIHRERVTEEYSR